VRKNIFIIVAIFLLLLLLVIVGGCCCCRLTLFFLNITCNKKKLISILFQISLSLFSYFSVLLIYFFFFQIKYLLVVCVYYSFVSLSLLLLYLISLFRIIHIRNLLQFYEYIFIYKWKKNENNHAELNS